MPVHVISPNGRLSVPKVRAFTDFAVPRLRNEFARLAKHLNDGLHRSIASSET
jgi:hypothetical protein